MAVAGGRRYSEGKLTVTPYHLFVLIRLKPISRLASTLAPPVFATLRRGKPKLRRNEDFVLVHFQLHSRRFRGFLEGGLEH